jgi:TolB protein
VSGLYVRNLETDSTWLVIEGQVQSPDWRPDGERIAFAAGNIFTIQLDGSDLQRVTDHGSAFFPSWAPGGTRLAYDATSLSRKGIWLVNPDGSGRKHLGLGRDPDWSTQGNNLLYQGPPGSSDSGTQLWAADTSATDSTQRTNNTFVDNSDPAWSPNGKRFAWTAVTDDGSELWIMRADGTGKQRLAGPIAGEPSWSPDSERLVFVKPDPETDHIALWTIRRDGSDLRQITSPSRNPLN